MKEKTLTEINIFLSKKLNIIQGGNLIKINTFSILKMSNEEIELIMKILLVLLSLCLVSSMGFAGCEQNPGECSVYTPDSSTVSNTDDEVKTETQKLEE